MNFEIQVVDFEITTNELDNDNQWFHAYYIDIPIKNALY